MFRVRLKMDMIDVCPQRAVSELIEFQLDLTGRFAAICTVSAARDPCRPRSPERFWIVQPNRYVSDLLEESVYWELFLLPWRGDRLATGAERRSHGGGPLWLIGRGIGRQIKRSFDPAADKTGQKNAEHDNRQTTNGPDHQSAPLSMRRNIADFLATKNVRPER